MRRRSSIVNAASSRRRTGSALGRRNWTSSRISPHRGSRRRTVGAGGPAGRAGSSPPAGVLPLGGATTSGAYWKSVMSAPPGGGCCGKRAGEIGDAPPERRSSRGRTRSLPRDVQHSVDPPRDARVVVGELGRQQVLRRALPGDRPQEPPDRGGADRGVLGVGR